MLFAHLKRILKMGRLRLRGPKGAQDEFMLVAIAQRAHKTRRARPLSEAKSADRTAVLGDFCNKIGANRTRNGIVFSLDEFALTDCQPRGQ